MTLFDIFNCPIPFSVKMLYTIFVCVLVPAYWSKYGPANFLWFSDLALLIGLAALWLESPLLASMQTLSVLVFELLWCADFLIRAITGKKIIGLAEYMFKSDTPLWLRSLSLFHLALPVILIWQVRCFGYDGRAWIAQTILFWAVVLACFFFTQPADNINWVFGTGDPPYRKLRPSLYLMLLLIGTPVFIYLPTHLFLSAVMPEAH
jgi:hypothetical protein